MGGGGVLSTKLDHTDDSVGGKEGFSDLSTKKTKSTLPFFPLPADEILLCFKTKKGQFHRCFLSACAPPPSPSYSAAV